MAWVPYDWLPRLVKIRHKYCYYQRTNQVITFLRARGRRYRQEGFAGGTCSRDSRQALREPRPLPGRPTATLGLTTDAR